MHSNSNTFDFNNTIEYKLYSVSKEINIYTCFLLVFVGLVGNLITIYLLVSKPKYDLYKRKIMKIKYAKSSIFNLKLSSSQRYMLGLAISDILFLIAHLIEDILPVISSKSKALHFLEFINKSNALCKIIIYIRNASRMCSAYLVVFFAYERYLVISSPLKRLKLHKRKFNRLIIQLIFIISFIVTSYSLYINGLRSKVDHEVDDMINFECDVKIDFKYVYDYIICVYITTALLIPILLVFYFNIFIAKVLLTRKNRMLRHLFPSAIKSDCDENKNSNPYVTNKKHDQLSKLKKNNQIEMNSLNNKSNEYKNLNKSKILSYKSSIELIKKDDSKSLVENKKRIKTLPCCFENVDNDLANINYHYEIAENLNNSSSVLNNEKQTNTTNINMTNLNNNQNKSLSLNKETTFFIENYFNPENYLNMESHLVRENKSNIQTSLLSNPNAINKIKAKLRDSGRATIILVLVSLFFIILNMPYIISWLVFYIPYKANSLTHLQVYFRYSFVHLFEIFHLANYCVNIFLYCMGSKLFRNEFMCRFLKCFKFKLTVSLN